MEVLLQTANMPAELLEQARVVLAKEFRRQLEEFIERGARMTIALPAYVEFTLEEVRPNTRRGMLAFLGALESADFSVFAGLLFEIGYRRAKQGLPVHALFGIIAITDRLVRELCAENIDDREIRAASLEISQRVCELARSSVLDAFQRSSQEAHQKIVHLVRQLSVPLLPVLPGVLIIPIIGAVDPARADQIIEVLLRGIGDHRAHIVILDITGITDVEPAIAEHFIRAAHAARLLGARTLLVGVGPAVATVLVESRADLHGISTHATLEAALSLVLRQHRNRDSRMAS